MKTILLAGLALAVLAVSVPADAARYHAYRGVHRGHGPVINGTYGPAFGGAYGAVTPAAPAYGLFYDQGNYVSGDPDPFVQGQILRDPNLGNQGSQ
jgi:hypothetical protein